MSAVVFFWRRLFSLYWAENENIYSYVDFEKKAEIIPFIFQNHIDKYLVIDSKGLELKFLYVGLLYVFVYFSYKIYNRINVGFYWFSFYKKKNYKCVKINRNMNRGTSSHVLVLF